MELTQREDIIKFIIKIQLNFENAYVTTTQLERELLVESWYEALGNLPKAVCTAAVNNVLKRAKFAPRLGDITEEAEKLLAPEAKSDEQLWAELTIFPATLPTLNTLSGLLKSLTKFMRAYPTNLNYLL